MVTEAAASGVGSTRSGAYCGGSEDGGMAAVEAFNRLSTEPYLSDVPAVLLASPKQSDVVAAAKVDARRKVLPLPVQPAEFARILGEIRPRKS